MGMQTAATMENSIEVPWEIKIELLYDSAVPLLGIYPKEAKHYLEEIAIYSHVHCSIIQNH